MSITSDERSGLDPAAHGGASVERDGDAEPDRQVPGAERAGEHLHGPAARVARRSRHCPRGPGRARRRRPRADGRGRARGRVREAPWPEDPTAARPGRPSPATHVRRTDRLTRRCRTITLHALDPLTPAPFDAETRRRGARSVSRGGEVRATRSSSAARGAPARGSERNLHVAVQPEPQLEGPHVVASVERAAEPSACAGPTPTAAARRGGCARNAASPSASSASLNLPWACCGCARCA